MDENRLIALLKDGTNLRSIKEERKRILEAFETNDEAIEAASLKMKELRHDVPSKTNKTPDAVFQAWEQVRISIEKQNRQLLRELDRLNHRGEEVNNLVFAMKQLPKKTKRLIEGLYLEEKSWDEVAAELNISMSTLKRLRKQGMTDLLNRINDHR